MSTKYKISNEGWMRSGGLNRRNEERELGNGRSSGE
jgi:hypothetical protein